MSDVVKKAEALGKIHYANCERLIGLCAKLLKEHPNAPKPHPISDLQEAELKVASENLVRTLKSAFEFISQPSVKPHFQPGVFRGIEHTITAIESDVSIAVQIGTGGPNPWKAPFSDVLNSIQNWCNTGRDPFHLSLPLVPKNDGS